MINTGVIGLGKMGISHCSIINAHPDFRLAAVADTSSLLLRAMGRFTDFKPYSDYKKMLEQNDLDAVFVVTPTRLHAEMVLLALDSNAHVFCEKPLSLNADQSREMAEKARNCNLTGQVGYHNRFVGTFNYMKKLLENRVLGDVYHFQGEAYGPVVVKPEKEKTWRSKGTEGGGCLFDYASHVVNLVQYVLGDVRAVHGVMLKRIYSAAIEDAVYSGLVLENGISGNLCVNWSEETYRKMSTSLTVWGTRGKIIADAQEIRIFLKQDSAESGLEKGWNVRFITDLTPKVGFYLRGEEYSAQIDHFGQSIKNHGRANINSFDAAWKTDQVIDLMIQNFQSEQNHGQNTSGRQPVFRS